MPANVLAGEIGITAEGREYIFRPSFRKLAELGSPAEIVQIFVDVQAPDKTGFSAALSVMHHFIECSAEDAQKLLGYHREVGGNMRYVLGLIREPLDIQVLAKALLKNGMIGNHQGKSKSSGNEAAEFNIIEFHGAAVAHLGISSDDAWNMTMLEFQAAMTAKYGKPEEEEKRMSGADLDAMWADVDAGRVSNA